MSYNLVESFKRKDKYGMVLKAGDICVWGRSGEAILCAYVGKDAGKGNKFGKFITELGPRSVEYERVVYAYPGLGDDYRKHKEASQLIRQIYG